MTFVTVVSSVLGGIVFVGAGLVVAVTVKRLFFAAWRGSLAVTTVGLTWLCWALGLGQLLGAVGLIRRVALLTGALVMAAVAVGLLRVAASRRDGIGAPAEAEARETPESSQAAEAPEAPEAAEAAEAAEDATSPPMRAWQQQAMTTATALLVFVVGAIWTARTAIAMHRGIKDPDSLGYHLPFIVTFAQSGYADQHRLLIPLLPVQFFPGNDELLSAMALALTHSLAFAAAKNLLLGGLVLVAAHALGKAYGAARLSLAVTAIALGFPVFAFSQPGEAVNDTLLLLLLLGGLAVLAHARNRPAPYVLVLACAGLMLGVKFSGIVPAAALAALAVILLLIRVPRHRWRWAGAGLLASAVLGGSWYVRNAIDYGNPIPPVHIAFGPLQLHTVHGADAAIAYSVAHYALHGRLLDVFSQGLIRGLGPLYLVLVALCLLGGVAAIRSGDRFRLGLSATAAVSLIGYVFTPAGAYGPPSAVPQSFVINLHYAVPALLAGAVAGAIALARWRWAWILPAVGLVAVATSISRGRTIATWSPELGGGGFALLLVATVVGAAVVLARSQPSLRRLAEPAAVAAVAIAVIAVALIAQRYPSRQTTDPVVNWAATVHHARIAEWTGNIADLYGPRAQNRVEILSQLVDGAAEPIAGCPAWKRAVRDAHVEYTAVIAGTTWSHWLRADPAFRLVADELTGATKEELRNLRRYNILVFQVVGDPDVTCPGQVPQSPTSGTGGG
ncbi:MAG: hypothetical protein QOE07_1470 [Acidimicrobiaceae bacterium]|nr:hypothetical protein [Acidimicrobiaceae bacterium]